MSGSGSSTNLKITLSAQDLASKQIEALRQNIAKLHSPSERAAEGIGKLTDEARLGKLTAGMRNVARDSLSAFDNIGRMVGPLGVITSATSIAGLAALSREWAKMGQQLGVSAQRAGVGVDQLSQFQNAARLSGASAQAATSGMTALQDSIATVDAGLDNNKANWFSRLGLDPKSIRNASDMMPLLAHKLAAISNPTERSDIAHQLLGGSADELMPVLLHYDEAMKQAQATGADWTGKMADDATQMNKAWTRFGLDFTGITNRIEDDWSGMTTKVLSGVSDWIEHNQKLADSYTKLGAGIMALGALKPAAWVLRLLGLGSLVDVAAPVAVVSGLTALGYKAAQETGTSIAKAAEVGLTPTMMDDFGNPIGYKDASGRTYTTEQAAHIANNRPFLGEGNYPQPEGAPIAPPGPAGAPRGIRNNNPLNLSFVPGQPGVAGSDGRFGIYRTMPAGIAADMHQLILNQQRGATTLAAQITKWAPPGENDTAGYIRDVSRSMGLDPNDRIDVTNPQTARELIGAMAYHENGMAVPDKDIQSGVQLALGDPKPGIQGGSGAPTAAQASETTVKGGADLKITLNGFPDGTATQATTDGNVFGGPPQVNRTFTPGMTP